MRLLAQKVARGEVEFTVMPRPGDLKEAEFTDLKFGPILGQNGGVSWAVRKNSSELMNALNQWIDRKEEWTTLRRSLSKILHRSRSLS